MYVKKVKAKLSNGLRLSKIVPSEKTRIRQDDVFLVSYPKSGNTWVRFLFSNLLKADNAKEITFLNVHDYCQEWESVDDAFDDLPSPRIIKSHQLFNPEFRRVIYLVRDCRDVYLSYYHYVRHELPEDWDFADFLRQYQFPFGYWLEHVISWTKHSCPNDIKIIRYEDLLQDTLENFLNMIEFSELDSDPEKIAEAVENSSFSKMRKIEDLHGRKYRDVKSSEKFVRKGQPGEWKDYFGDEEMQILIDRGEDILLKKLGYD